MRFMTALWAAKLIRIIMRLLGRNATYMPGNVALKICPDFLSRAPKPQLVIAVTGTNGKTTVSNLLGDALAASGRKALDNRLGSNVSAGIATSLARGAGAFGGAKHACAVFEVDERSSGHILPSIKPDYLVITNLFQDSIMRNAHPGYIAGIIGANVPPSTKLILNADDIISSGIAPGNGRAYFGLGKMASDVTECINIICDIRICPLCGGSLLYDYRRYHHIGRAHCSDCSFSSPDYDYRGEVSEGGLSVSDSGGAGRYKLLSDYIPNIYNMLTVITVLREAGLSHEQIADCMGGARILESRYSEDGGGPVKVVTQMAKDGNALANSRVYDYVSGLPGRKEIIFMNDVRKHGNWTENTYWLYDADFEFLNSPDITRIALAGRRIEDYRLRLLLAGVPDEKIVCAPDELSAPAMLELKKGGSVYIFYGTDTIELAGRVRDEVKRLAKSTEK